MGFRFAKRIKIAPGIRLNVGARGISTSIGVPGASVTVGKRGVYANAGLPGTGLSYRTRLDRTGGHGQSSRGSAFSPRHASEQTAFDPNDYRLDIEEDGRIVVIDEYGGIQTGKIRKAVLEARADEARALIEQAIEAFNEPQQRLDQVLDTIVDPRSARLVYPQRVFSEIEPKAPKRPESDPPPVRPEPPAANWLSRLFPFVAGRRQAKYDTLYEQWVAKNAIWEAHCAAMERQYQSELTTYQQEQEIWTARKTAFEAEEQRRAQVYRESVQFDANLIEAAIEQQFAMVTWPRETLVAMQAHPQSATVFLDVDLPEIEDMPAEEAQLKALTNEYRMQTKTLSETRLRARYAHHIHSIVLRCASTVFQALPFIREVVVSGYSQRLQAATGHIEEEYLISSRIGRKAFEALNFDTPFLIDPVDAVTGFDTRRRMTKSYIFKAIEPFPPEAN